MDLRMERVPVRIATFTGAQPGRSVILGTGEREGIGAARDDCVVTALEALGV